MLDIRARAGAGGSGLEDRVSRPRRGADPRDLDRVLGAHRHRRAAAHDARRARLRQADEAAASRSSTRTASACPTSRQVIDGMRPLPGAAEFLGWLRERFQVRDPVGHLLRVRGAADAQARPPDPLLSSPRGRRRGRVVRLPAAAAGSEAARGRGASRELNFRMIAAGDSYNDTSMLAAADVGHPVLPARQRDRASFRSSP